MMYSVLSVYGSVDVHERNVWLTTDWRVSHYRSDVSFAWRGSHSKRANSIMIDFSGDASTRARSFWDDLRD
jgi:hypothetical protein